MDAVRRASHLRPLSPIVYHNYIVRRLQIKVD